jgi:hypothetical protein
VVATGYGLPPEAVAPPIAVLFVAAFVAGLNLNQRFLARNGLFVRLNGVCRSFRIAVCLRRVHTRGRGRFGCGFRFGPVRAVPVARRRSFRRRRSVGTRRFSVFARGLGRRRLLFPVAGRFRTTATAAPSPAAAAAPPIAAAARRVTVSSRTFVIAFVGVVVAARGRCNLLAFFPGIAFGGVLLASLAPLLRLAAARLAAATPPIVAARPPAVSIRLVPVRFRAVGGVFPGPSGSSGPFGRAREPKPQAGPKPPQ